MAEPPTLVHSSAMLFEQTSISSWARLLHSTHICSLWCKDSRGNSKL